VDKLFNEAENIEEVRESFINIANRELEYRKLKDITYEDVLNDIEDFAKGIIYRKNASNLEKIFIGMRKFMGFMLERKFLIDKEILICASKTKYLINVIRNNEKTLEKYIEQDISDIEIPKEHKKRLKAIQRTNKEAYYYIIKSLN